MRLCFVADARSPIAQNWIAHFIDRGHHVEVISTYPAAPPLLPGASLHMVPVAFSQLAGSTAKGTAGPGNGGSRVDSLTRLRGSVLGALIQQARGWLGPLDVFRWQGAMRKLVYESRPDLVHAMRLPYEGMLAAEALRGTNTPLLVSIWGNDFTLFADRYPLIAWMTRRALHRADALHPDCFRDLHLAGKWGFRSHKPAVVLPGAGGIQTDVFFPGAAMLADAEALGIPPGAPVILNPRGMRGYVRNDTFFRAIPFVLQQRPDVVFLGAAMRGNAVAEGWVQRLGIGRATRLLPSVPRDEMAGLFRLATVVVSPSEHDGTPNTLLEGMACGAFPIAGDIESIREWIDDGANGFLCDPGDPESLARAILRALADEQLRLQAMLRNQQIIAERADFQVVMAKAEAFYREIIKR